MDTLVDVDTDSETESSDGKDKNMEFDKVMFIVANLENSKCGRFFIFCSH